MQITSLFFLGLLALLWSVGAHTAPGYGLLSIFIILAALHWVCLLLAIVGYKKFNTSFKLFRFASSVSLLNPVSLVLAALSIVIFADSHISVLGIIAFTCLFNILTTTTCIIAWIALLVKNKSQLHF